MGGKQGVVILGSTGSIGTSTLEVIAALSDRFDVVGLAAASNHALLQAQIDRFRPRFVHLGNGGQVNGADQPTGDAPLTQLATLPEVDIVVVATTGHAAIEPTIAALRAGKIVALANKETIVAAGELVMKEAAASNGVLRPVDSEHSALWQCLGSDRFDARHVRKLILTASGGPFRGWTTEQLRSVTPAGALNHPTWSMGAKVTIDSATLMNKGLEIIEAHWLFRCPLDAIDVVVHPQSIVHSLVEFRDGSLMAQLAQQDMKVPIQYALTYPDRVEGATSTLNLLEISQLSFEAPDVTAFPLLRIARESAELGSTYPTVLSAADDFAVEAFLDGRLSFNGITAIIEEVLSAHDPAGSPLTLDAIHEADGWARRHAETVLKHKARQWMA